MQLKPITHAMLVVTHSCNLRCRYCFVQQQPQTMTYETAKAAVHFLMSNCLDKEIPSINFFGGEPMLCWDSIIVPLVKYIRGELKIPFELSMTTNGTLLNPERISFLKQNKVGVLFSIDGDKETQNYNRPCADGSNSFEILKGIIPLLSSELNPTFRMTVIPESCSHLFDNIVFADNCGFKTFFVIPNVFQNWTELEWNSLKEEMRKYSNYVIECYQANKSLIHFSEYRLQLQKIKKINQAIDDQSFRVECDSCYKCGLGASRFASIHPNGEVYACQEMTSQGNINNPFWIGNIYTGILDEKRRALMTLFHKDKVYGLNCEDCPLNRICDGGCVANNYLVTGDVNHVPNTFCNWQQLLLSEGIYIMNALADNPIFIQEWRNINGRK